VRENITQCRSERKKTGDVQNWGCSSSKIGFEPGRLEYISPTKLWFETIKTADIDLF
jgi:hypothetical protein